MIRPEIFPSPILRILAAGLVMAISWVGAAAQRAPSASSAPSENQEQTFFESIDVNVVNVEVYVTDRQGQRVQGLTQDDFQLLEDGKAVDITNFYTVSEGQEAAAPTAEGSPTPLAAGTAPSEDSQKLYLAIFIDNRTLVPASRKRLLDSVQELVSRLAPGDRLLLASYDGSVKVRQGVTSDPAALRAALQEMATIAPNGISRDSARRNLLRLLDSADSPGGGESQRSQAAAILAEQLYHDIRSYGQQQYDESRAAMALLREFVDSLAGLPGRKALLFVSGGMSLRPAEALLRAWESRFSSLARDVGFSSFDFQQFDTTPLVKELIDHANSNRVTFYALAETTELAGISAESGLSLNLSSELEVTERTNLQMSMQMIAGGTGGLSSIDAAGGPLIDRMRDDFHIYYSLGYVPQQGRDGRKRKVEVKTRDRSLVVRHREAHNERTDRDRMTSRARSALLLGEEDNPLEVAVEFGRETRNDKGQYEVEVLVKFPLAKVVLVPQDQFHEGRLRLFVGARDSHGRSSPISEVEVPIRVPNDQLLTALGQVGAYRMTMLLRPEAHTVAVAVRDELGNAESTARADYTPGQQEQPRPPETAEPGR